MKDYTVERCHCVFVDNKQYRNSLERTALKNVWDKETQSLYRDCELSHIQRLQNVPHELAASFVPNGNPRLCKVRIMSAI